MINTGRNLSVIMLMSQAFSAGAGHDGGWMETWLMSYDFGLTFWSIITFLVVLFILKWKAWGPLIEALDKREEDIKNALQAAEKAKLEAESASRDYDELVKKAQTEAQQIISDSKVAGEKMKSSIQQDAQKNADELIVKAQTQINAESQKAIQEIRSSIVNLSIEAASKIIEKNLDNEDNKRLVNQTIDNLI